MRILNKKQLAKIPTVDAGNLYLGMGDNAGIRARVQRQEQNRQAEEMRKVRREMHRRKVEEAMAGAAAQKHEAMLRRSLQNSGRDVVRAANRQGNGFVKQYGVNNHLLGFVDEVRDADYNEFEVMPAEEFNNHMTAKNVKAYTRYKDFPLVEDAKSDFGGVLTNEKGSADFSTMIVNDAPSDFGGPRRPRRK